MRTLLLAAGLLVPWGAASAETVTILHTNDVHSRIEPITKYDNTCNPEDDAAGECFGGSARLATALAAERDAADGEVLLLDGGDEFQGTLFYTYYKGAAAAEIMNTLKYDAMTVGNHEFDDGPEVLAAFADKLDFPLILGNAVFADGAVLEGKVPPTTVIEKGGIKYGLIGLAPVDTAELSSPGDKVTLIDPVEAVSAAVDQLTAEGVSRIIVLSHSGYDVDQVIASEVPEVDLIVGGHSHTLLSNVVESAAGPYPTMVEDSAGNETPVVQAGAYGKYLGKLVVEFDEDGHLLSATGEPILLDASIAPDADLAARVAELAKPLEEVRQTVIGEAADAIDGSRETCRAAECTMGNLVADAMLDRVKSQGVLIAIQNGGGLRASIDAGDVTMGDVLTVLPFQNTLATFTLTGEAVQKALENGASQIEEGAGRFAQVSGLRYTIDMSVAPGEGRVKNVEVDENGTWTPLDPAAEYGVVSNDFMRRGGDGYAVFAEEATDAYDSGPNLELVVSDFIAANSPYVPALHDRITVE